MIDDAHLRHDGDHHHHYCRALLAAGLQKGDGRMLATLLVGVVCTALSMSARW